MCGVYGDIIARNKQDLRFTKQPSSYGLRVLLSRRNMSLNDANYCAVFFYIPIQSIKYIF